MMPRRPEKLCLRCKQGVGGGPPEQCFGGGTAFLANIPRVRKRHPRARTNSIGKAMNPERIAFADEQRHASIFAEETRLRLYHTRLMQLSQGLRAAHEDIGVET
jgi:hypothetical protein